MREEEEKSKKRAWCFCRKDLPTIMCDKKFQAWCDKRIKNLKLKSRCQKA